MRKFRLVLLPLVLVGSGCFDGGLPPAPPETEVVLQAFGDRLKASAREAKNGSFRPLHLYVDSSGSMKGYVNRADSDYAGALRFLLEHSATAGYDLRIHGFAEDVSLPLGNVGAAAILRPGFYSGRETSFPNLFDRITREHGTGAVSVIVSDLVQSGRTGDQRALVLAFQRLAGLHPEVLLLAFRSSFEGRYFIEGARAGSALPLALDGTTTERSRPFYVLVVARSRADLDQARRFLLADLQGHEEFDASSPALTLDGAEYLPPGSGSLPVWNVYKQTEVLATAPLTPRTLLSFLEIAPPVGRNSPLRLRFSVQDPRGDRLGSLRSTRNLSFAVDRRRKLGSQWKATDETDISPEALFSADGKLLTVSYSFPRPNVLSWDLYRVRLLPGAGNLRLPSWVEEWSTPDDSLLSWGNRTLKLDLFIEAMTRSLREQVPISEHYILLGRGE